LCLIKKNQCHVQGEPEILLMLCCILAMAGQCQTPSREKTYAKNRRPRRVVEGEHLQQGGWLSAVDGWAMFCPCKGEEMCEHSLPGGIRSAR
jgi:hypothetical protein